MTKRRSGLRTRAALAVVLLSIAWAVPLHAYVGPGAGFAFLSSFLALISVFVVAFLSLLAWPFRFLYWLIKGRKAYARSKIDKLVIVGLDGMDPDLAEKYMAEGKLPNLSKLREEGFFGRLRTTTPSISPVAWSSFMTGANPSKHNIFDFLNRDPRTYLPGLSSAQIGNAKRVLSLGGYRIPLSKPEIRGMRKSVPFWKILGDHGFFSSVLRVPITFPPERFKGHLLSGMCAPDLKGSQGTFSFYSSNAERIGKMEAGAGTHVSVADRQVKTSIVGPVNTLRREGAELRLPLTVTISPDGREATLDIDGQTVCLKKGELSPWIRLTFRPGLGIKLRCLCRFLVSSITPDFEMYVSPLNIDPARPALPISHPFHYSVYLAKLLGNYVTLGLANDTWALNEGALTEDGFLDLAYAHHSDWEKMFFNALDKTARGAVVCVFETTDSIQHMFFRHLDENHPAHRSGDGRRRPEVIEELYRRMDEMIGRVQQKLDDRSVLIVMSDHGFKSFRRGVNLNTWLIENGYMELADGNSQTGEWFRGVDWSRTKAYALGLGGIYLNLKGREAQGIVAPGAEAARIKKEITDKLTALVDGDGRQRAINKVSDRELIYNGPYKENSPDLIVGFSEGYRASWESVKGVAGPPVLTDNCKAWSGDHCIDADVVPGVLFCSSKLGRTDPCIWDIAPTALDLFGVPIPAHMDGTSLIADRSLAVKQQGAPQ